MTAAPLRPVLAATALRWALALGLLGWVAGAAVADEPAEPKGPIKIAKVKHTGPVNFERQILPVFRRNCLACHNRTSAKAGVLLESPEDILKGGDNGRIVVPRRSSESSLLKVSAHQTDPVMPPRGNKASAVNLTPEELGWLKLWIDQGAKGEVRREVAIDFQPLPPGLNPIFAVAITPDGQFAAAGRANQIHLYHLPTGQLIERLTDPQLLKKGPAAPSGVAHRDMIYSLAFSPDGTRLVSGSYREAKVWQRLPETPRWNVAKAGMIESLAASPDGRWLAAGAADGTIRLWDEVAGRPGRSLKGSDGPVAGVQFSPDGTRLVSFGTNQTLTVWEVRLGKPIGRWEATGGVRSAVWNREGTALITGGVDGVIRRWQPGAGDLGPWELTQEWRGHVGPVTALAVLPPGAAELVSGGADGSVRLWDLGKGETVKQFAQGGAVSALAARGDGRRIASAGSNSVMRLWDVADGKQVAELKGDPDRQLALATREREQALAGSEVALCQGELQTAEKDQQAAVERGKKAQETLVTADKLLAEKQKSLAEAVAAKAAAEQTLRELAALLEARKAAADAAQKAALEADAAAKEAKARAAAEAKADFDKFNTDHPAKQKAATDQAASAEKARAAAEAEFKKAEQARQQADTEAQLAAKAGEAARQLVEAARARLAAAEAAKTKADELLAAAKRVNEEPLPVVHSLGFSPDGRRLVSAARGLGIRWWNATDGSPAGSLAVDGGRSLALTSEGRVAVAAAGGGLSLWEPRPAWRWERSLGTGSAGSPLVDRVNALAFTPDGQTLITGGGEPSRDGELKLWRVADGALVRTISRVHSDAIQALAVAPDGRRLATGAADRFARIVDLESGTILKTLEGHTHHVLGVAWKPDNRTVASAGMDKLVKLWNAATGERRRNIEGYGREVTAVLPLGATGHWLTTTGDQRVRVVDDTGKEVRALPGARDYLHCAAVTPDGRHILAGGQDSVLLYWKTDGEPLRLGPAEAKD